MLFDRRKFLASSAALASCAAAPNGADADTAFRALAATLPDLDAQARWRAVQRFDAATLTPGGCILYQAIKPGADAEAALARLGYGANAYAVTHRNGEHRRAQPDAGVIAHETERLEHDAARGVIAPDYVLTAAIASVEAAAQHAPLPARNALLGQSRALQALTQRARPNSSAAHLPNGEEFYRAALQFQLGGAIDPRVAHDQATAQAAAFTAEAQALLRSVGVVRESAAEGLRALIRAHRPGAGDWRGAALESMRAVLTRAPALIAPAFAAPAPPAQITALPAAEEAGGTRGRREGDTYIVDLGGVRPRWTLPSVVFHETIPGHALQSAYEAHADAPAIVRRYAASYSEGWATYAEMLADELGGFAHDPLARLGYLHWMLFRMARVVGDTGMHVLGWNRARTIEEIRALQGQSVAFVSIEEDVTRIAAQPGVAAAQGLAALNIAGLRERAGARANFTLPAFHDAMLRHGPVGADALTQSASAALGAR